MKKIIFFSGAAAFLLLLALLPVFNNLYQNNKTAKKLLVSGHGGIFKVADGAFGPLASLNNVSNTASSDSSAVSVPRPESTALGFGVGTTGAVSGKIMPPYEMVNYKYVYKGEDFKLDSDKMEVFKRIKGKNNAGQMSSLLSVNIDLGLINFSNPDQYTLQNISFAQNQAYGYLFNISLEEGNISLYTNWNYWPQSKCQDQACWDAEKLTKADVLGDDTLISIANDFVKNYGISLNTYDNPEVVKTSNIVYASAAAKSLSSTVPADEFISEYVNVVYPLKINDKIIYENGAGSKTGLSVTINIKEKKVSSVYNLNTQDYQSSNYSIENSWGKLKGIAEKGGLYAWTNPEATKTVELELGTPTVEYTKYWQYLDNKSEELLIPTLVFPILNSDAMPYGNQTNIAIPLVRDILDSQINVRDGGVIIPLITTTEKAVR